MMGVWCDHLCYQDQFSVMTDIQGRLTVGFYVGGKREGVVCVEPSTIKVIRDTHKTVASLYQKFIRQSSLPANLYLGESSGGLKGHWGGIMVRTNYRGEIMIKIEFNQRELGEEEFEEEKKNLVDMFSSSGLPVVSLYLAVEKEKRVRNCLLLGEKTITEEIQGVPMLLGPDTFCQGNIACTEVLLGLVAKKVDHGKGKTLLDLCCGGGLFSLHLARMFRGCVGVDMVDTSHAKKSAELNQLDTCTFLRGRVQAVVPQMVADMKVMGGGVSAVLNPGRAGVHYRVIQELRRLPLLDTLVYVSCQPEDSQVYYNMMDLMAQDKKETPAKLESKPFSLVDAIPVDMFPHTHHCEHVFVFKR